MTNQVAFNAIPGNLLVPFWYAEFNSGGTPFQGDSRLLLVGQKLAAGSATAGTVIGPIHSEQEAGGFFGANSMLVQMFRIARLNAPFAPLWVLPLADPAGAAATGSLNITSAPAVTGVAVLRIMGRPIAWQVNAADTAATVAANGVAAINKAGLPIVAAVDGVTTSKIDLTAAHVGAVAGNFIDLKVVIDTPNVLTASNTALVAMSGGTGVPSLTLPLAALGDDAFDWIASPYSDTASLNSVRDFLDGISGRWSPVQQLYGHHFTVNYSTLISTQVALGAARNDSHASIMAVPASPSAPWEWAAGIGGIAILHLSTAPELSRPLQTLIIDGILPPDDRSTWWHYADRQALYQNGMAAFKVTSDALVYIDRLVTTYQHTTAGIQDGTFRDVETMAQGMFAIRFMRNAVSNRHSRQAIADENPFNVQGVTTPADIRNTLIHAYYDLVALGVAENPTIFAQYLIVERDGTDPNRVNAYLPIDVVNQLRVFAANVTAFLQFRTPSGEVVFQ